MLQLVIANKAKNVTETEVSLRLYYIFLSSHRVANKSCVNIDGILSNQVM